MGSRRSGRFAQDVNDDSSGKVSQPQPPSGGASVEGVKDQEQAKAKAEKEQR